MTPSQINPSPGNPLADLPHAPGRWHRFAHAMRIIARFWCSREAPLAWALLALLLGLQYASSSTMLAMADWEKSFFDMLQAGHGNVWASLLQFGLIVALIVGNAFLTSYLLGYLSLRWRTWLTGAFTDRWLAARSYYRVERAALIDNPDQRIAEDIALMTDGILGLVTGLFFSAVQLWQFSALLMTLSAPMQIDILGHSLSLPGDMVIYGLLYAVGSSLLVVLVGRPLVSRTVRQQHFEADYRFALIHVRRKAEQIALTRAEPVEGDTLRHRFGILRANKHQLIVASSGLGTTQTLISQLSPMVPILLLLPRFFARGLTIGDVMQGRNAFNQMAGALSWFMQSYGAIAAQVAILARLRAFEDALEALPEPVHGAEAAAPLALDVADLTITLPGGALLAHVPAWQVRAGQRWVVRGPSGAGKSTLLRTLAGLWPHAHGQVNLTDGAMFLPQRAYLPLGSLRQAVCFPAAPDAVAQDTVAAALETFGLAHLTPRLDSEDAWEDVLSPGEQQRLAMARVLIHRPAMLVMDEATSALDAENAAHAYRTLASAMPGLTMISVVHADALEQYHHHILRLNHGTATPAALGNAA